MPLGPPHFSYQQSDAGHIGHIDAGHIGHISAGHIGHRSAGRIGHIDAGHVVHVDAGHSSSVDFCASVELCLQSLQLFGVERLVLRL